MKEKILFLAPYPLDQAPSQRFRFELFLDSFPYEWDFQSFYDVRTWNILYVQGYTFLKVLGIFKGYVRRIKAVFCQSRYKWIYVHRELTPFGPPIFEYMLKSKKLIYDFDDAIWMDDGHDMNWLWKWIKHRQKIEKICSHSSKVIVGNSFLAAYAKEFSQEVVIIPTLINSDKHKPRGISKKSQLVVGWTGSHTTLIYLEDLQPVLKRLQMEFDFNFLVIANVQPELDLKNWSFEKWSKDDEVDQLNGIDIGIMPLKNQPWELGKCGFKLIQYGAVGLPSVASPVGVNSEVLIAGETGLMAESEVEWYDALKSLLLSESMREQMGNKARARILREYSKSRWENHFQQLFD